MNVIFIILSLKIDKGKYLISLHGCLFGFHFYFKIPHFYLVLEMLKEKKNFYSSNKIISAAK